MAKDYKYKKEKTKEQEVELTITVTKDRFATEKANVFKTLSADVSMPGFRPGKGPQDLMEAKLGTRLYEETLQRLLPKITLEVLKEEDLSPITQISYQVVKVAEGDELVFKAIFVEFPKIKLGDFTKIKVKDTQSKVTDEDVEKSIHQLVDIQQKTKGATKKSVKGKDGKEKKAKGKSSKEKSAKKTASKLTDKDVKEMKLGFETVGDLKKELRKRLEQEKKVQADNEKIQTMVDEAIKISKIEPPKALINAELDRQVADYTKRVEELNIELDDFLKTQNTTLEELKDQWEKEVVKRISSELLYVEIARANKLTVVDSEVQRQIDTIMDPKLKKEYDSDRGKQYITTVLLQQKALKWLKDQVEGIIPKT